jgi:hypothetical protein
MGRFSTLGTRTFVAVKLTQNPAEVFRDFTRQEEWRDRRLVFRRLVTGRQPQCNDLALLLHVPDPRDLPPHGIGRLEPRTGSNADGSPVFC